MNSSICGTHRVPLEILPAEPRSRCSSCGYMTHHLRFEHCPECGVRLVIEQPDPRWECPLCAAALASR
jgi:hypothetical protein